MNLQIVVQHHPSRAELLPPLLARLGGAEVVTDPDPEHPVASPLRCYLECHRRRSPEATHLLILQDDTWPADDFRARAEQFISEHPDDLCALFVPGTGCGIKHALRRDLPWVGIRNGWTPTVALAWPQEASESFLAFAEETYDPYVRRGDDSVVGEWRKRSKWPCAAPLPSLVEHPDLVKSLFRRGKGGTGTNRARKAARFTG